MPEREDYILEEAEREASEHRTDMPVWKRILNRRRRTKLHYRKRTLLFLAILFVFLLVYVLMFLYDNPMGDALNDWTDSIIAPVFTWLMTGIGGLLGRDWSDMGGVFAKISTLGPLSYIVVSAVIAFAISAIVAWVYGHYKTKGTLDDGTPNFVAETDLKK